MLSSLSQSYCVSHSSLTTKTGPCERFPKGIATTEINLELGQIHFYKTAPRKPRNILRVLAVGPRLDLQGSYSRHY